MAVQQGSIVVAKIDGGERVVLLTDGYGDNWQGFSPFPWMYEDQNNHEYYNRGGESVPVQVRAAANPSSLQEGEFRELS